MYESLKLANWSRRLYRGCTIKGIAAEFTELSHPDPFRSWLLVEGGRGGREDVAALWGEREVSSVLSWDAGPTKAGQTHHHCRTVSSCLPALPLHPPHLSCCSSRRCVVVFPLRDESRAGFILTVDKNINNLRFS